MNCDSRVYALIDISAIKDNIESVKKSVGEGVMIMGVIKADAYGHGAVPVAKAIEDTADYFAVATVEEALELRENGIRKPILVLGHTMPQYYGDAVEQKITVTVFRYEMAKMLSVEAQKQCAEAKIHIAVDTGMSRIGLECSEKGVEEAKKICELSNISVEGIFSHFATADEGRNAVADAQIKKFNAFCEKNGISFNDSTELL